MPTTRKPAKKRPVRRNSATISASQAEDIRSRYDAYEKARRLFGPRRYDRGGGYSPSDQREIEALAGAPSPSNEERGLLEVYDFVTSPPDKYFVYIDEPGRRATTWTGESLGSVSFGSQFKSSFGDVRVPLTLRAINGKTYAGTYFKSAGDYARIKMTKTARK